MYLREDRNALVASRRTAGLYHIAIRLPSRQDLATFLGRTLAAGYPVDGAADHGVSEALYLTDPDSNGIEVYIDRPRSEWVWENGQISMMTDALDIRSLLESAPEGSGNNFLLPPHTDIGHIHLQIGDLKRGEGFYGDLLGFDVTQRSYPGALFLSSGGYHHHVGLNIWGGRGLPPRSDDSPGLESFRISVPDHDSWMVLRERVKRPTEGEFSRISETPSLLRLRDADGISVEVEGPSA